MAAGNQSMTRRRTLRTLLRLMGGSVSSVQPATAFNPKARQPSVIRQAARKRAKRFARRYDIQ